MEEEKLGLLKSELSPVQDLEKMPMGMPVTARSLMSHAHCASSVSCQVGELADFLSLACSPKAQAGSGPPPTPPLVRSIGEMCLEESEEEMLDWSLEPGSEPLAHKANMQLWSQAVASVSPEAAHGRGHRPRMARCHID